MSVKSFFNSNFPNVCILLILFALVFQGCGAKRETTPTTALPAATNCSREVFFTDQHHFRSVAVDQGPEVSQVRRRVNIRANLELSQEITNAAELASKRYFEVRPTQVAGCNKALVDGMLQRAIQKCLPLVKTVCNEQQNRAGTAIVSVAMELPIEVVIESIQATARQENLSGACLDLDLYARLFREVLASR